jgi:hypothetical protein
VLIRFNPTATSDSMGAWNRSDFLNRSHSFKNSSLMTQRA